MKALRRFNPFNYILLTPWEGNIGNAAEHIYYGLLLARLKRKKVLVVVRQRGLLRRLINKLGKKLLGTRLIGERGRARKAIGWIINDPLTNAEIFKLRSPLSVPSDAPLNRLIGRVLDDLFVMFIGFNMMMIVLRNLLKGDFGYFFERPTFGHRAVFTPDRHRVFTWEAADAYHWDRLIGERVPVHLEPAKEEAGRQALAQMGLPEGAWYVALHVRERGFYAEPELAGSYRSADIDNYLPAIKYITEQGGWVVRMGDRSMKPLPKLEQLIDYPFTEFKSDLLDLYLIEHCRLYLGMDSGIWDVAHLFQKKILLANSTNWNMALPPQFGDLSIIKHFYSKARRRLLSVRECLEADFQINFHYLGYPADGRTDYLVLENTPAEILQLVREKLEQGADYRYSDLQRLFIEQREAQVRRWIGEAPFLAKWPQQSFRLATRCHYQSSLGRRFLQDNWEYGPHLAQLTEEINARLAREVVKQ